MKISLSLSLLPSSLSFSLFIPSLLHACVCVRKGREEGGKSSTPSSSSPLLLPVCSSLLLSFSFPLSHDGNFFVTRRKILLSSCENFLSCLSHDEKFSITRRGAPHMRTSAPCDVCIRCLVETCFCPHHVSCHVKAIFTLIFLLF